MQDNDQNKPIIMNRKEELLNLFGFLMDLLKEPTESKSTTETTEEPISKESKVLDESALPVSDELAKRMKELMDYTTQSDEKKYRDMGVKRIINQTLRPILEQIKVNGANNLEENLINRSGVTFDEETGKMVSVDIPVDLRDEFEQPNTEERVIPPEDRDKLNEGVDREEPNNYIPKPHQPNGMTINVSGEMSGTTY